MPVTPSWKTMARTELTRGNSRISSTASKRMPLGLKGQLEAWDSSLDKEVQVGTSQLEVWDSSLDREVQVGTSQLEVWVSSLDREVQEGTQLAARQQGVLGMGGPEDQI